MRRVLASLVVLGGLWASACKAHVHGTSPDRELVTIKLTHGLS